MTDESLKAYETYLENLPPMYTKLELQKQYADLNNQPWFMQHDGKCINCHSNIPEQYTEEYCKTKLITRCKRCGRSLLD